jgi:hypothetical protein
VSDGLDPAPLPEGLGIPADDWHRSCTSSLRLIPATYKLGTMPSFQHLYEGVLPWSPISFFPVGAGRSGVAVPHAPVGVVKRPCHDATDPTSPHTIPAQASLRAHTLCGPHHKAALQRLRACQ